MKNKDDSSRFLLKIFKIIFFIPIIILKSLSASFRGITKAFSKRLKFSITFKITTVFTFIYTILLFIMSIGILGGFFVYQGKTTQDNMSKTYDLISSYLTVSNDVPKDALDKAALAEGLSISLFNEAQDTLYSTESDADLAVFYTKFKGRISQFNGPFYLILNDTTSSKNLKPILVLNKEANWNNNKIYIQITNKLLKETQYIAILSAILFSVDIIFIIITILIGSRASKNMLKPIQNMTKTVKNISINALDTRLDIVRSHDELKDLAETFNRMLDRIQQSVEAQNQFVSDASHELRTPIAVIQGYANMLDRWGKGDTAVLAESITAIKNESDSMKDLVEKLLFLARGDKNTQKIEKEDFYLEELIEELVKETILIDKTHEISKEKADRFLINADRKLLKESLRIFIDNSIKYTPVGEKIKLSCYKDNSKAVIEICDNGIGISKEDLPNIFNRFYRADKSRTKETGGTGLGLAIAKWIVLKHKGTIEVESQLNMGTKITVFLPL